VAGVSVVGKTRQEVVIAVQAAARKAAAAARGTQTEVQFSREGRR
jgi:hypothetical protein